MGTRIFKKALMLVFILGGVLLLFRGSDLAAQGPNNGDNLRDRDLLAVDSIVNPNDSTDSHTRQTGSSPFAAPEANDITFVVDKASALDTGCSFRSEGPLVFDIEVNRVIGDKDKLLANGLIADTALLRMPAFDVDFVSNISGVNPERDRVFFNDRPVQSEFLTGENDVWKLNSFNIPIDWVNFPDDPGDGGTLTPASNTIRIDIDTANTDEVWCTAIDWAALSVEVARPVLMLHGILSDSSIWNTNGWKSNLESLGLPTFAIDMGALDSIQSNANKIANAYDNMHNRLGVDEINIVSHSKGGLDSRHYAESHDTVATLAQLGTPNAGSRLANLAQVGAVVVLGRINPRLIGILSTAAPAGYQLTTFYMDIYNYFHSYNQNTSYVSLAGDYRFGGWGILDSGLEWIHGGPSDIIVPVSSVHALSYAKHLSHSSTGSDDSAWHGGLHGSNVVYNQVVPSLKNKKASRSPSVTQQVWNSQTALESTNLASTIYETETLVGAVSQGQSITRTLPFESVSSVQLMLYHETGNLDLTLISPSGVHINPTVAANDPNIDFDSFKVFDDGLYFETYAINNPEAGIWTLDVSALSVDNPAGEEAYFLTGLLTEPSIQLTSATDQSSYKSNEPLVINATLVDSSAPITSANVEAKIVLPDESFETVTLLDDGTADDQLAGDGIYTGRFNETLQAGLYRLLVTAKGQTPSVFSRQQLLVVPVSASGTQFSGTFADNGNDTDADALFNELVIDVGLDVTESATYQVLGVLLDNDGAQIATATANANLNSGSRTVNLRFDGSRIFEHGVDGPYKLGIVRLAEDDGFAPLPLDERLDAYTTASYSYRQFQHSSIFIPSTGSDQGVDVDGNGLFDQLVVNLDIDILTSGSYEWSGRLVDVNGTEIGFAANSAFLNEGANTITFTFNGESIGTNRVDGPYFLRDLLIFSNTDSAVVFQAYSTSAYEASEFEALAVIPLNSGWNLVSVNRQLANDDVGTAMSPIAGSYSIVLSFENGAFTYDPVLPQHSTLTSVDGEHGYWIRMNNGASLTLRGQELAPNTPVALEQGWNLVSYLAPASLPVEEALASIAGKYTTVLGYDQGATSFYNSIPPELNTLNMMEPGLGYWIKMTEAATLVYPESRASSHSAQLVNRPQAPSGVTPTNEWVNLFSTNSTYNGQPLPSHTVITAIGEDGRVLGKAIVRESGSYGVLSVYRDDSYTAEVDGARRGEQISFLINGQPATITNGASPTWSSNGDLIEVDLAATGPTMNYMYLPMITR